MTKRVVPGSGGVAQSQSPIAPGSAFDDFPIIDALHMLGGLKSVNTILDRNRIPFPRLQIGMVVFVKADGTYYRLLTDFPASRNDAPPPHANDTYTCLLYTSPSPRDS